MPGLAGDGGSGQFSQGLRRQKREMRALEEPGGAGSEGVKRRKPERETGFGADCGRDGHGRGASSTPAPAVPAAHCRGTAWPPPGPCC